MEGEEPNAHGKVVRASGAGLNASVAGGSTLTMRKGRLGGETDAEAPGNAARLATQAAHPDLRTGGGGENLVMTLCVVGAWRFLSVCWGPNARPVLTSSRSVLVI